MAEKGVVAEPGKSEERDQPVVGGPVPARAEGSEGAAINVEVAAEALACGRVYPCAWRGIIPGPGEPARLASPDAGLPLVLSPGRTEVILPRGACHGPEPSSGLASGHREVRERSVAGQVVAQEPGEEREDGYTVHVLDAGVAPFAVLEADPQDP